MAPRRVAIILSCSAMTCRAEVERLTQQLRLFGEALEVWTDVQRAWVSLEPIFAAPDITRQLPGEAKAFATVDRRYKDLMRRARDHPNALQVCCGERACMVKRREM